MAITLVNPGGLPEIDAYRQVSIATGSKLVFVAGQVSWDAGGATVGEGDLAAQVERCYVNVGTALAGAGATFDDVAKINIHVVDWTPDKMPALMEGISRGDREAGSDLGPAGRPSSASRPSTSPSTWFEVEVTAVID